MSNHVSRREAARLLGFASDFPIRQLEKEGHLRAVRGAMGQAWYPREAVLGLLPAVGLAPAGSRDHDPGPVGPRLAGAWSDAELIGLLRELLPPDPSGPPGDQAARPRTVVDLVADTGIPIARATRIHRFWLTHDRHPAAELARAQIGGPPVRPRSAVVPAPTAAETPPVLPAAVETTKPSSTKPSSAKPSTTAADPTRPPGTERRGPDRVEREQLIRRLRDPDPAVRALAFEKLRPRRRS